jgi:selenocysteine-specific elongation factor
MRVIGTAGHVDHGKSTLVQALTGTHPDRLKEEREREMTIELGFAWLTLPKSNLLPDGEEVGIVDVPGHRDFIENMLSGVGGIDAALFVVAADEGVMPQTREHLSILDILQIKDGVVALTKADLIEDVEWLEMVKDDVREVLKGTVLEQAPIISVSARTRAGIPALIQALSNCFATHPQRPDLGRPRLPVDRIFTMPGFGTIVTGTLVDGQLRSGEEVQIMGSGSGDLRGRIRGLQTHKKKEDSAVPGSRTALNISGVDVDQIKRGDVVIHPGDYKQCRRLDVRFRLLPNTSQPLKHNTQTKLFIGATETLARVRLLGVEELDPGEEAFLQLELENPIVAIRGDRYILRRPSPGETLGGGEVIDSQARYRHKRFSQDVLERLEAISQGTPAEILLESFNGTGIAPFQEVVSRSNLESTTLSKAFKELYDLGQIVLLDGTGLNSQGIPPQNALVASKRYWTQTNNLTLQAVQAYHQAYPLRRGIPKEELKSRLRTNPRIFNAVLRKLIEEMQLDELGPHLRIPGHTIKFNNNQQKLIQVLWGRISTSPYAPPTIKDCIAVVQEDVFNALVDLGELVVVSPEVVFRTSDYLNMVEEVKQILSKNKTITAAQVRDHFNTSRRYVLAFLEFLDSQGITLREGDIRRLKQ